MSPKDSLQSLYATKDTDLEPALLANMNRNLNLLHGLTFDDVVILPAKRMFALTKSLYKAKSLEAFPPRSH